MDEAVDNHYTKIAETYDEYFGKTNKISIPKISEMLELKSDDRLLDLGTGTGMIPSLLRESAGLKFPVKCVEPCGSFVDKLKTLDGLEVVQNTAESFSEEMRRDSEQGLEIPYNKVLMSAIIHHLNDAYKCLDNIINALPKNGIVVFSERPPSKFPFPLLEEHLSQLRATPSTSDELLKLLKTRNDIRIVRSSSKGMFKVNKELYCDWIRRGFLSYFKDYTKEQLEEYLEGLKREHFGGMEDGNDIAVNDEFIIIKCTKV